MSERFALVGVKLWLQVPVANVGDEDDQVYAARGLVRPFVSIGKDLGPATISDYDWLDYGEVFEDE